MSETQTVRLSLPPTVKVDVGTDLANADNNKLASSVVGIMCYVSPHPSLPDHFGNERLTVPLEKVCGQITRAIVVENEDGSLAADCDFTPMGPMKDFLRDFPAQHHLKYRAMLVFGGGIEQDKLEGITWALYP